MKKELSINFIEIKRIIREQFMVYKLYSKALFKNVISRLFAGMVIKRKGKL